jgi:hypothetical protein
MPDSFLLFPKAGDLRRRPRIYFEEWDEPKISCIRSVSELMSIAGGDDIFPERATASLAKDRTRTRYRHRLVVGEKILSGAGRLACRIRINRSCKTGNCMRSNPRPFCSLAPLH